MDARTQLSFVTCCDHPRDDHGKDGNCIHQNCKCEHNKKNATFQINDHFGQPMIVVTRAGQLHCLQPMSQAQVAEICLSFAVMAMNWPKPEPLKPCPTCGYPTITHAAGFDSTEPGRWLVRCENGHAW